MGQYHILVNLTKKEFVYPHQIGNGLKLLEQVGFECSTATALTMLIAASNGRGGGDFEEHPLVGSWAGDKIAFVGDYGEQGDLNANNTSAKLIYDSCSWVAYGKQIPTIHPRYKKNRNRFIAFASQWKDISLAVQGMMSSQFNVVYQGSSMSGAWLDIVKKTI